MLYDDFHRIAQLHFEQGNNNLMEKTMAELRVAESQRKQIVAEEQLKIETNRLNRFIYSEGPYAPVQKELELYGIRFPENMEDKFYPFTFKDYFQQQVQQKNLELGLEKSKYFPEFRVGYFQQDIASLKNLRGFQVGVVFPIWFFPQAARVKESKLKRDIALNQVTLQTYELEQSIDDLKIKLDQAFINIIYYRENALNQADLLINTTALKYQNGEIEYMEYLQNISEALKIKEEYLKCLLNYNITAVELEYYLN
ncbi:MAG: TolC family protein [Bacteroidetes bacterium]|nr:TolC family protein [Bacteroidota bacterium]